MKVVKLIAVALFSTVSAEAHSAEQWLSIVTAKGGYEFKGTRDGDRWSFIVPGRTIRTKDDNGRMFADIDGVMVQTLTVPLTDFPKGNALDSHRRFETDYLTNAGAHVSASSICASMKLPHREWKATDGISKTAIYISVATRTHVLVVVVSLADTTSVMVTDSKLRSVCSSLKV